MPRQNNTTNLDTRIGRRRQCKVRKRGTTNTNTTTSSSSSLAKNYRLKRCVLIGRKTPAMENKKECLISARKLGANLWEMNGLCLKKEQVEEEMARRDKVVDSSSNSGALVLRSPLLHSIKRMDLGKSRRMGSGGSLKMIETECELSSCRDIVISKNNNRLKDVYNSLMTSRELLKVMNKLCNFHQQDSTLSSLFSALKFELNSSLNNVTNLLHDRNTNYRSEMEILLEEEKMIWKLKEQDRIRIAIASVTSELEKERRLKRQTERLNMKLGIELAEIKESLSNANKDLESGKRALEILEHLCHDLACGISEDRAQVEKLKKQSEKERDEVEKEREMLQLADILREERVQMKLCEAKYQFEEKNAAVDNLRNELESYLNSMKNEQQKVIHSPRYEKIVELEKYLKETMEEIEDEDDRESDLHSIELNAEDLAMNFQWINKEESVQHGKRDKEEMERYKMIKDLRDRIVSGARMATAQDHIPSSSKRLSFSKESIGGDTWKG